MTQEANNVALLKDAYARWNDTKGASVDHWFKLVDPTSGSARWRAVRRWWRS